MNSFSFQNVLDGQGIGISITGMAIVYIGLVLISVSIALLPTIIKILSGWRFMKHASRHESQPQVPVKMPDKPVIETKSSPEEFNDIASVIGLVLQLEHERFTKTENEQITILRKTNRPSLWGSAGKMRKMPQRRTHA